jgi:cell fate (sporulation/competence/biofilm development) regulator YlbF (YheA/YmcA/DUF963 family)
VEENQEETNDSTHYYGGIEKRDCMNTVDDHVRQLIQAIKDSQEYREYKKYEQELKNDPEKWNRINEFRARNFRFQREFSENQELGWIDQITREAQELHKCPEIHGFLQAELGICRLLQYVNLEIVGGVDIYIPEQLGEMQ